MRYLVKQIAQSAHAVKPSFLIIPQNGQSVAVKSYCTDCASSLDQEYLNSISAIGREDLFYGYISPDQANTVSQIQEAGVLLDAYQQAGIPVLVTDYCGSPSNMDNSYNQNDAKGYIGFAAPSLELDEIPSYPAKPHHENNNDVTAAKDVENFLFLLDPAQFSSRTDYLQSLASTNYDLLIIDAFYEGSLLTKGEVNALKVKPGGGQRLVVAYMNIGEAEDFRYYWQSDWNSQKPDWVRTENPDWPGEYKIEYWNSNWHNIIYGNSNSYLQKLLDSDFDGAYLDKIDSYESFEE